MFLKPKKKSCSAQNNRLLALQNALGKTAIGIAGSTQPILPQLSFGRKRQKRWLDVADTFDLLPQPLNAILLQRHVVP